MSISASAVDYSIGGRIDEVLSKRTTFSTLMRPEKEADETFLSSLYGADAGVIASPQQRSHYQDSRDLSGTREDEFRSRQTDSANIILSNEDTIRRGYVDVMARWALTKGENGGERVDFPKQVSSRGTLHLNINESPAQRMATRLRLAHEHIADTSKRVASKSDGGGGSSTHNSQVGNPERVLELKDKKGKVISHLAHSDRRPKVPTKLQSPAERMAERLRRARELGNEALILVASETEENCDPSNQLPGPESNESDVEENDTTSKGASPIEVPLLSPAARMASRLLEARRQGNTGLVFVSSREIGRAHV